VKIRIPPTGLIKSIHGVYLFAHTGPSMNPTLDSSDLLEVRPYRQKHPCRGDVIIFQPEGFDQPVVHRIVKLSGSGIITRGDNGTADDPWQLRPDEVFGQVIAASRRNKRRRIAGGASGMLFASRLRCWKTMYRAAARMHRICRNLCFIPLN
jgi:hypothetical protein